MPKLVLGALPPKFPTVDWSPRMTVVPYVPSVAGSNALPRYSRWTIKLERVSILDAADEELDSLDTFLEAVNEIDNGDEYENVLIDTGASVANSESLCALTRSIFG